MYKQLTCLAAFVLSAFSTASLSAAEAPPKLVEINLSGALLSFASKTVMDKECAALLSSLKSVSTRVYDLSDRARDEALTVLNSLRKVQTGADWTEVVSVNEQDNNTVHVMVKQLQGDTINGVSITVLEQSGKGILVEIDGELHADQIAKIAKALDIDIPGVTQPLPTRGSS